MASFVIERSSDPRADLEGVLLGMGNPLLDISADVSDEFMTKYDVKPGNAILAEEKHVPMYNELVENYDVKYIAGGATQNSIRVAQWMLQEPGATSYAGCIGNDKFGKALRSAAQSDGVAGLFLEDAETDTGTCGVLITGGERSLVANLAAANKYKHEHTLSDAVKQAVEKAKVFYIAGFFLTVCPESIEYMGKHAAENNKAFCLNLSAPFLIDFFAEPMAMAMPYTDVVFSNEDEAASYAKKQGWDEKDLGLVALKLAASAKASGSRPRTVIFTQGSEPTIVASNGIVNYYPVEPLAKSALVDTNGAGDAFVGGFLSRFVKNESLSECVRAGHYAARVVIQQSGCCFPAKPDFA